ncbi:hypothetical protein [Parvibaculum sp.]|jgi:hypothetical protein|uniref:hypothetical protein n=1 Tax=Parvibaculum sp. TaxID=2024848 RepID=UPI003297866B
MSTKDGLARSEQRRDENAAGVQADDRQKQYYDMLAARLEGLLDEIEKSGLPPEDDLVKRLRALQREVSDRS